QERDLARDLTEQLTQGKRSCRSVGHGDLLFRGSRAWVDRRSRFEELRASAQGAIELQGLAVHDLPLLVADGERADLLGDLVEAGIESRRASMRGRILAEHRPHAADLSLDVLGGRIEGLVRRSIGERLHEQAVRPRRLPAGSAQQEPVGIEQDIELWPTKLYE